MPMDLYISPAKRGKKFWLIWVYMLIILDFNNMSASDRYV